MSLSKRAIRTFFERPEKSAHRQYEALRAFLYEGRTARQVAERFGYSPSTVYTLVRNFRRLDDPGEHFFPDRHSPGRSVSDPPQEILQRILELREARLSVPDIKARLDAEHGSAPSLRRILACPARGWLPALATPYAGRTGASYRSGPCALPPATRSIRTARSPSSPNAPLVPSACCPGSALTGLDRAIEEAGYPGTSVLPPLQSVLAFVALKLSDFRRYSADDLWCMDRGLGLFAGLNVLPKTATLSAYSDRATHLMHQSLLGSLAAIWKHKGLLGDTVNLDFTTLPHWGDDETLRKHWSSTRGRALLSISAALAQDPDSGLLLSSDAGGRDSSGSDTVLEFLSFSRHNHLPVRYLVFDSRCTTYANLARLNDDGILFVTVRRRGKALLARSQDLDSAQLRQIRVPTSTGTRLLTVHEQTVPLRTYRGSLRQITLLRGSRRRPAFLITNDFNASLSQIMRLYARRWRVEQSISEQLSFFHLNRLSSSMVIQVDFDLAMTVLAYNLLRLLAHDLPPSYRRLTPRSLFERFLSNAAQITLSPQHCDVALKKKRDLPALLEALQSIGTHSIPWLGNRQLRFRGATTS